MVVPCAKMRGSQGAPSITRPSLHHARAGQQFARYPTSPPTSTALSHPLNNPVALAVRLVKSMKKECLQDEEPRPDRLNNPANNIIARQSRVTPEEPRPNLSDEKKTIASANDRGQGTRRETEHAPSMASRLKDR